MVVQTLSYVGSATSLRLSALFRSWKHLVMLGRTGRGVSAAKDNYYLSRVKGTTHYSSYTQKVLYYTCSSAAPCFDLRLKRIRIFPKQTVTGDL